MKKVHIIEKLQELNFSLEDLTLGDFDIIGELCAKKQRSSNHELYKTAGAFFRPNYERGILIYALILEYDIRSFLEIGFGRGHGTICAAMAMHENGGGTITTIDPNFDQNHIERLKQAFPKEWFDMINFTSGYSQEYLSSNKENYDFIYIDGDHKYEAVKRDWELCKDRYDKVLLFDDYIPPKDNAPDDIQCSTLIDSIEDDSKELIIMDRRIFFDDRRIEDDDINYGQVLLTRDV